MRALDEQAVGVDKLVLVRLGIEQRVPGVRVTMRQNRICRIEGSRLASPNRNAVSMTFSEQGRPSLGQAAEIYDDISRDFSAPVGYLAPGGIGIQACCNVRQMILICFSIGSPSIASCGPSSSSNTAPRFASWRSTRTYPRPLAV
jgi:hypothetical protein